MYVWDGLACARVDRAVAVEVPRVLELACPPGRRPSLVNCTVSGVGALGRVGRGGHGRACGCRSAPRKSIRGRARRPAGSCRRSRRRTRARTATPSGPNSRSIGLSSPSDATTSSIRVTSPPAVKKRLDVVARPLVEERHAVVVRRPGGRVACPCVALASNWYAGPAIGPMPPVPSSGNSADGAVASTRRPAASPAAGRVAPVLFGDSLTGCAQSNAAPDVARGEVVVDVGQLGGRAVRPAVVARLGRRPSTCPGRPGRAAGSASLASGE